MSDRFKFRVWNIDKAEYDTDPNFVLYTNGILSEWDSIITYNEDRYIVEQCTGLKDKKGNLIYEGDIIHEVDKEADIDDVSQIVWCQDTCHFMRLDLPDTGLDRHCLICEADSPYIEIIGNIHKQVKQKDK